MKAIIRLREKKELLKMVQVGQLTKEIHVWKQGMANWELAGNVQELIPIFAMVPPPPPQAPPPPPM